MNSVLITIILIPIIEIYLFIKIGSQIGALNTISLIFITAIIGVIYARYEGLNTLRSGFSQLIKNETPAFEIISGAAIAFAALLLIVPGFLTDILGFVLIVCLRTAAQKKHETPETHWNNTKHKRQQTMKNKHNWTKIAKCYLELF